MAVEKANGTPVTLDLTGVSREHDEGRNGIAASMPTAFGSLRASSGVVVGVFFLRLEGFFGSLQSAFAGRLFRRLLLVIFRVGASVNKLCTELCRTCTKAFVQMMPFCSENESMPLLTSNQHYRGTLK